MVVNMSSYVDVKVYKDKLWGAVVYRCVGGRSERESERFLLPELNATHTWTKRLYTLQEAHGHGEK